MNDIKYKAVVKSFSKNNKESQIVFNKSPITGMTSITKEEHSINNVTGMPDAMARLYLHSSMKSILGSKMGNDIVEKFFRDDGYIDIIISDIRIPLQEKVQLHSLWGDNYFALYHGIQAPSISLSGFMYNARNNDWWDEFMNLYLSMLRGSELAKYQQVVCLNYYTYNNIFFSISNFDSGVTSLNQSQIQFGLAGIIHKISIKGIVPGKTNPAAAMEIAQYEFPVPPERVNTYSTFKYDQYYKSTGETSIDNDIGVVVKYET